MLFQWGEGVPNPGLVRGYTIADQGEGGTPSSPGQGVPNSCLGQGGYPIQSWPGGTCLGLKYPYHLGLGYLLPGTRAPPQLGLATSLHLERTWDQYPLPQKEHGTSGSIMGWRYYGMDMWYSPCEQTHTCENSTFPILRMRAVIKPLQINIIS